MLLFPNIFPGLFRQQRREHTSTDMQLRAQALIAAYNSAGPIDVMSNPPTISVGGDWESSTINISAINAPSVTPLNAKVRPVVGGNPVDAGGGIYHARWAMSTDDNLTQGASNVGYMVSHTGRYLDIAIFTYSGNTAYHIWLKVNGEWHKATPESFPVWDAARYVLVDFGSTATRDIEIYIDGYGLIYGFNFDGTLNDAPSLPVRALWIGDSYSADSGAPSSDFKTGLASKLAESMGVVDFIGSGIGSQGWVTLSHFRTIGDRIPDDVTRLGNVDLVFAHGSVNDSPQTEGDIQTAVAAGITGLQNAMPNAFIVFLSSFTSTNLPVSPSQNNAARNGALSTADSSRTLVIDTVAESFPVVTSEGDDGIHPSADEAETIANLIAPLVVAWLSTKA